jgi:hypothetical protein
MLELVMEGDAFIGAGGRRPPLARAWCPRLMRRLQRLEVVVVSYISFIACD